MTTPTQTYRVTSHLLGERIDTRKLSLEGFHTVMQAPRICVRDDGVRIAVFRFGAVVIAEPEGVSGTAIPDAVRNAVTGAFDQIETETAAAILGDPNSDAPPQDGVFVLADFSVERFSVVADALAKSVALARDEQRIGGVFEQLEPFASELERTGGRWLKSNEALKLLGGALLAQHRMVGRVEVDEKPDILWDRSDLQRLHNRLSEEYELPERGRALSRKVQVIEETARAISEVADAYTSRRLEIAIIALIAFEIVLTLGSLAFGWH